MSRSSYIVVHPLYREVWPRAADYLRQEWKRDGFVEFVELDREDSRSLSEAISDPSNVERLVALGVEVADDFLDELTNLEEAFVMTNNMYEVDEDVSEALESRGVTAHRLSSEGFWAQSVAELAVGLTVSALRQIPQKHMSIISDHEDWDWDLIEHEVPGANGFQYVEDPPNHVHGSIADKRVRIVGAGNIGSRYADFVDLMGADIAAYDPFADEPCFHRTGARRVHHLDKLPENADIFAPMVPLTESTRGLVTEEHINSLPEGSLLLLVTRAGICDMDAVRERVLNDEIALAADVFDKEPLPLDDSLLGRDNVVHTPHVAGRTRHANKKWAEQVYSQFHSP